MRRAALTLALALPLLAGTAQAQQQQAPQSPETQQTLPQSAQPAQQQSQENGAGPPAGSPDVQNATPESQSAGQNQQRQVPETTDTSAPTGAPAAPQPEAAPTPVAPVTAPPPEGTRGPTAEERELEAALKGERIEGRISIPNQSAGVLVQPEGRDWRVFHNRTLPWVAGTAVVGTVVLLALFFLLRGRVRIREGFSGRTMLRFNFFERAVHWMTASCFIVLALSGLNLIFGRELIRPLIGPEAFTTLSYWGKAAHNFLAFPFTLGILLLFIMWVGGNLPTRGDMVWLMQGGGMVGSHHPKADRFNAGQKGIFWITVLGGAAVSVSGYLLVFPFTLLDVNGQQWAHMTHGIVSAVMMAAILAHIYIGTLGMEGAFSAMGSGKVDYNWAREHHELWVEQELAKAHETIRPGSGGPSPRPAGAD
ncbi:formate dehydrogenase subunit gamma [Roseomonas marmotae]|uniref:Formate dehydrogenase subunit gamma n=1 Tax=Roseomonas marmotae TaxID=2768161 RepID=A0ABS3KCC4_9PROT|nr:formate dehydrogenase subunit gamma [Roseomonas marmotae]MBO1075102.1 formate dehydrogenase subunit gamma [Roseomonas marmotae]QTI79783.1 formate dehydrogenase subunit gamma [Roseomonas marmotae]